MLDFLKDLPNNSNWLTPPDILEHLRSMYGELFDPCPINPTEDGLKIDWRDRNFINPPYSRGKLIKWLKKGYEEFLKGKLCVFLIPSDTSTVYWHKYVMRASYIYFFIRRIKFVGAGGSPKFGSVLVLFDPDFKNSSPVVDSYGR
jgi:hypothetical protein